MNKSLVPALDRPLFSVLDPDAMIKIIAASGHLRRPVDLPEFAQQIVMFEGARRDFTVSYPVIRKGAAQQIGHIHLQRGEALLVNEVLKDLLLSYDQPVKMFFEPVRPVYTTNEAAS